MPLVHVVIVLIVVGVLLWLINRFIPMAGSIKSILNAVVVIAVVLWLLNVFGILGSLRPLPDSAGDRDDILIPQPLRLGVRAGRDLWVEYHLCEPPPVTEVNKDESPMVPPAVHPSAEGRPGADVRSPQFPTCVRTHVVCDYIFHFAKFSFSVSPTFSRETSCSLPVRISFIFTIPFESSSFPRTSTNGLPDLCARLS